MIYAVIFRSVIILFQLAFVFIIASQITIDELGVYYKNLSIAFLLASLIFAYPEFVFQSLISERLMNRNTIKYYLKPLIFLIILLICIAITTNNELIGAITLLLSLTMTNMLRTYLNVLSFKILTMTTQVFEGALKLIFLCLTVSLFDKLKGFDIINIQIIASLLTIKMIYFLTLRNNSGQRLKNISSLRRHTNLQILIVIFNTFINSAYVNFLKIYLSAIDALEEVGLLGLTQQLIGNLVQSINSILQIQYGNQILRGKSYFNRAFTPIIALTFVGALSILFAIYFIFPLFDNEYQNIPFNYFIFVFIFELYIIPLSFLINLYIREKLFNIIIRLHLLMAFAIFAVLIVLMSTGSLQFSMLLGCIFTFVLFTLYYRKLDNV